MELLGDLPDDVLEARNREWLEGDESEGPLGMLPGAIEIPHPATPKGLRIPTRDISAGFLTGITPEDPMAAFPRHNATRSNATRR